MTSSLAVEQLNPALVAKLERIAARTGRTPEDVVETAIALLNEVSMLEDAGYKILVYKDCGLWRPPLMYELVAR